MNHIERPPSFDPYQPLGENLKFGDVLNRWILLRPRQRIVHLLKGQRVLDVCCGTGNLTAMLAAAGCQVVGVDSSPTMLSYARGKRIKAEIKQMDATQLPFNHEFDAAVISIALHEMLPQSREKVWDSMLRAVRAGGRLVALDYAVPKRVNALSRFALHLIDQDESGFPSPEHYKNFQEFMQNGGLLDWIQKQGQSIEADYRFWGGTVAVVVVNR